MKKKAVILLSGGLDSTTCMGIAQHQGFRLYPLTCYYHQRHSREIEHAKKIAKYYQVAQHKIVNLSFLGELGGSALTDNQMVVRTTGIKEEGIPSTYVPARNLIFLSLATAYAEVINAIAIFVGVSAVDYSGYPDCRPEFIQSLSKTIHLGTKMGVTTKEKVSIKTPLIHLSKKETIQLGLQLKVPYHLTTSCYQGGKEACGVCDSCLLRLKGFSENQIHDPIFYRK
jgi:7-cyano-7-deazaguanine synthase